MKVIFVYGAFENIGIEYLSAVLRRQGHTTRLAFDPRLFNDPFITLKAFHKLFTYEEKLVRDIVAFDPGIVAFSVIAADYEWTSRIAKQVKSFLPLAHITFGGVHPTCVPEKVLQNPWVDSLVRGEGEYAFLELVNSLDKGKLDYSIKNIWFKHDGSIIKNEMRSYIENLDSLPFPDKELYYTVLPYYKSGYTIVTRRGCINSCAYCNNAIMQRIYAGQPRLRMRSVENVMEELKAAKGKYPFKRIRFNDDIFTYNESWLKEFAAQYKTYIDTPMYCFGSPGTINENVIKYLKMMQCYQICLGVQSLNPGVRENILHRKEDNEKIQEAIALCRKYKIRCVCDNIIGLPGEKEEDLVRMAMFYNRAKPDKICVFWLIYFPQTPIVDVGLQEGSLTPSDIQEIEDNPCGLANTVQNEMHNKEKNRYHWLLLLYFIPHKIYKFVIAKKLYRYFPACSPSVVEGLYTMVARDRLDIPRRRYYPRYFHYAFKMLMIRIACWINRLMGRQHVESSK